MYAIFWFRPEYEPVGKWILVICVQKDEDKQNQYAFIRTLIDQKRQGLTPAPASPKKSFNSPSFAETLMRMKIVHGFLAGLVPFGVLAPPLPPSLPPSVTGLLRSSKSAPAAALADDVEAPVACFPTAPAAEDAGLLSPPASPGVETAVAPGVEAAVEAAPAATPLFSRSAFSRSFLSFFSFFFCLSRSAFSCAAFGFVPAPGPALAFPPALALALALLLPWGTFTAACWFKGVLVRDPCAPGGGGVDALEAPLAAR